MMQVTWRSPSNIALIKYWGKHGNQLPNNASLSITLHEAFTQTSVTPVAKKTKQQIEIDFRFEGRKNNPFAKKIESYLSQLTVDFPWLKEFRLKINSNNSFPHSAGIASSASSMSALSLCICSTDILLGGGIVNAKKFFSQASHFARIGSGSAARSVFGEFTVWGSTPAVKKANNLSAIPYPVKYHAAFNEIQDTILIVHAGEKSVSSRAGHALMDKHPMAAQRYANAGMRLKKLLNAIQKGNWDVFGNMIEAEALELHALMMTSDPSFILIQPGTLQIIEKIRTYRKKTGTHIYFTLDAGPNVHVMYPYFEKKTVRNFIQSELMQYCVDGKILYDFMGKGPRQIIED